MGRVVKKYKRINAKAHQVCRQFLLGLKDRGPNLEPEMPTYPKAKSRLEAIRQELKPLNESAVASLDEGLEETLTLHRLGQFEKLGPSFKTTNCIENVQKQLATKTDRVDRWQNSNQRQRWVATALLVIEPRLKKVKGHRHLAELRSAMKEPAGAKKKSKNVCKIVSAS